VSIATCNIKNYRLRRLAIVGTVLSIPLLIVWELGKLLVFFLVEAWDECRGTPSTIRQQWRKDYK